MWNRMKKWLHHVLQEDPSNEDELSDSSQSVGGKKLNNEFQTKMVYQYPKQGEFRFPVIPDDKKGKKRSRASERRSQWDDQDTNYQESNQTTSPTYNNQEKWDYSQENETYSSYSASQQDDYDYSQDTEEHMRYPFVPSDVPSPIYGFGNRTEQEEDKISLEDLPAFLRNQKPSSDEVDTHFKMKNNDNQGSGEEQLDEEKAEPTSEESLDNIVPLHRFQGHDSTSEEAEGNDYSKEKDEEQQKSYFMDFGDQEPLHQPSESMEHEDIKDDPEVAEDTEMYEEHNQPITNPEGSSEPNHEEALFEEERADLEELPQEEAEPELAQKVEPDEEATEEESSSVTFEEESMEDTEDSASEDLEEVELEQAEEVQHEEVIPQPVAVEEAQEEPSQPEDDQKEQPDTKPTSARSRRPFNVIMTPRDKRNRDLKAKQTNLEDNNHKQEAESAHSTSVEEETAASEVQEVAEYRDSTPPMHMLNDPVQRNENDDAWVEEQMQLLETTLQHFHVKAKVVNAMKGPAVTRFEVQPEPGVKVSKITNLADDIKLSLAAKDIRMEAPIPGKNAIGIEVPNQEAQPVSLQEILESPAFSEQDSPLSVGLGLDIAGSPVITDLKKMPHGLIAGATGSGKSVSINTILISLLYKAHYEDVKFLLIDPKMVELAPYNDLPHLVAPVITDVKAATSALKWAVKEMEERYEKFVAEGVRDIDRYNEKMKAKGRTAEKMPYMVIVIDELADLMMVSPQDVEDAICRIAQKARACGMHLLLATQRPSVDVITGLIKANIPTRVAFSVSSQVDSRTIIDTNGAEKLLGKGDMLFLGNGAGKGQRIQGAFVSDDEIERITNYVKKIAPPNYMFEQEELLKQTHFEEEEDDLFEEAVDFVINQNGASASLLQRRFKVGYNRAARLIDTMEEKGIISGAKGSKPREVYMSHASFEEYLAREKD